MDPEKVQKLLNAVASGALEPDDALAQLRDLPFEDLGYAKLDHHRSLRKGYPETIFGAGKTPAQIIEIARHMAEKGTVLATRCSEESLAAVKDALPEAVIHKAARAFTINAHNVPMRKGYIGIVCAGTSDLPVAEEAAVTCETHGSPVKRIYDVGVAGIHRLFAQRGLLDDATVLVVCAGMEGALPSVVAGLVDAPVIACPTSVGYGASFEGVAALLGMLNSCATGLTVVNIDNGFGAASAAVAIHRLACAGVKDGGAS